MDNGKKLKHCTKGKICTEITADSMDKLEIKTKHIIDKIKS